MPTHTGAVATTGALLVMAATFATCGSSDSPTEPVANSCSTTIPPQPGFQPPEPWPVTHPNEGRVWYGTGDLWTSLATDGNHDWGKSVWWSVHFGGGAIEPDPEIGVVWRRLDDGSALVIEEQAPGTNAFTEDHGWAMLNGIDPDESGCWEVTATYRGATLSYVYEYTADDS